MANTFRLTQTEITSAQWLEFVRAYQPYYTGSPVNPAFTGPGIIYLFGTYTISGNPQRPASMSWEYAAKYCNWLCNGKGSGLEAFTQGAYDTSTFTRNPDGSFNHNLTHAPNAQYWIPSLDEWVKATYYDPNKYGEGQEGYWYYPGKSDVPLISGPTSSGGQTNAGPGSGPIAVGSYPNVQSPWGLLDSSGGVAEWTSTSFFGLEGVPIYKGTSRGTSSPLFFRRDQLDDFGLSPPNGDPAGLRLASFVPSAGWLALVGSGSLALCFRKRSGPADRLAPVSVSAAGKPARKTGT